MAARPEVGGGHMMRSISLAKAMMKHIDVHFVIDTKGEYWLSRLENKGLTVEIVNKSDNSKLTLRDDRECLGVLVDDYAIAQNNLLEWKQRYGQLAVIDDFGDAPHFVDFVISPGLTKNTYDNDNHTIMCGSRYALLSPEYSKTAQPKECDKINTILLSFGFFDSKNCTEITLNTLNKIGFHGIVKIAIGSNAIHLLNIKKRLSHYVFKTEVYVDVDGLYDLSSDVDLVIGAGGVSLLERMALGKPSITVVTAYNQMKQSQWAENVGATKLVDVSKEYFQENLQSVISNIMSSKAVRKNMSANGMAAIDGKGALRVSEVIMSNVRN